MTVSAPTLHWPDDVLEQFLFDHGDNGAFVNDYGGIDLRQARWQLETIPAADFNEMPTGESDADCIESYAKNPMYWAELRPHKVGQHWETHGTWLRTPILLARRLLNPVDTGLQVLEGRTRVGVLRGRLGEGLQVASHHQAWVGHPATAPGRNRPNAPTSPAEDVGPRDWQITNLRRPHDSRDRAHRSHLRSRQPAR